MKPLDVLNVNHGSVSTSKDDKGRMQQVNARPTRIPKNTGSLQEASIKPIAQYMQEKPPSSTRPLKEPHSVSTEVLKANTVTIKADIEKIKAQKEEKKTKENESQIILNSLARSGLTKNDF
ncbi:hypothetical protein SG34_032330 [Thalassomonas viridans]|uniref:Uncharacterized protein n=1 Tax=Thalassomonas viridans TaxID=137584 RepID=A0AAF0CE79_9GAMM|nr:hypothetical protein [Thalassomonas viridans]WDE08609.1 hypothetical protein SG34_032330 [Thalassomonas viridans]